MTTNARVDDAWAAHRPNLISLAFRMLGDIGEAEDVVQEAFTRLLSAEPDDIEDARGWLTVVTSRLCLDQIRSARHRLQRPDDLATLAATVPGTGAAYTDPADRVTLDDSVRLALTVVLDRLTPAERVVFVLHDIFQIPFEDVAETVGRTAPACRQLARRARAKIDQTARRSAIGLGSAEHRLVTERFIAASATGDLAGLLEVLDPAVAGWVDLIAGRVVVGAEEVAANIVRFWSGKARLVAVTTGPSPVLLGFLDRRLRAVLELVMSGGRIVEIHVITAPSALADVTAALG